MKAVLLTELLLLILWCSTPIEGLFVGGGQHSFRLPSLNTGARGRSSTGGVSRRGYGAIMTSSEEESRSGGGDASSRLLLLQHKLSSASPGLVSIGACVDASTNSFQDKLLFALSMANAADAVEIMSVGFIMTVYTGPDGEPLTSLAKEFLTASVFVGMLIGGLGAGILADRIGRRPCLITSLAVNLTFALASAAAPSVEWLVAMRVAAGLGIGGSIPTVFTLGAEMFPTPIRGRKLSLIASFWMVGSIFGAGTAWLLLGDNTSGERILPWGTWQYYAIVAALPALTALILAFKYVPESPRYLGGKGDTVRTASVLETMLGMPVPTESLSIGKGGELEASRMDNKVGRAPRNDTFDYVEQDDVDDADWSTEHDRAGLLTNQFCGRNKDIENTKSANNMVGSLFTPALFRTTATLLAVWFTLSYGSYGISTWSATLFDDVGLTNPFLCSFIYALANLPGNVFSIMYVDKIGRRAMLGWSMLAASLASTAFAYGGTGTGATGRIVTAAALFNAFSVAGWNCLDCLSAEVFPLRARTTGMGLVAAAGRAGSIAAQFVNGSLEGTNNVVLLLLVTSGFMGLGAGAAFFLPREMSGVELDGEEDE